MDKSKGALTCQGEDPHTTDPAPDPAPTTPPTPDMKSEACKACGSTLGASDCKADDNQCLVDQCKNDGDCKKCKMDCDQYANL